MSAATILRHLNRFKIVYVAVLILAFAIYLLTHLSIPKSVPPEPSSDNYVYERFDSAGGVTLHVVRTNPTFIRLRRVDNNVTLTGIAGVNGGFFWEKQLLSIAVQNDAPVAGAAGAKGTGWFNAKYPRGTLVYDGATRSYSVQVVGDAGQLSVTDRSDYWAQGGISMSLQDDAGWRAQAEREAIPVPDDWRLRSALAYDEDGDAFLIVTDVRCTADAFRQAIREYAEGESHRLADAIFLDGDGSSQLLTREEKLQGDGRPVVQMIGID